jgi:hypothetical protein
MGAVVKLDPESTRLLRLAETLGEEALSEGEKWRLANVRDHQRRLEAQAAQQSARINILDAHEHRLVALEEQARWAKEVLPAALGGVIGEAEAHAGAEAKTRVDELRIETDQKLEAQYSGFEHAVRELRDGDRAARLASVHETLGDAESRIDDHLEKALEKTWERCELEVALVRDELMNVIAEKKYGVFTDDDPAKLAERAIAELRQRMTSIEEEGARAARSDQLAGVTDQLAALESEQKKITKKLLVRCAANAVTIRELAGKVAALETTLENLVSVLRENNAIG